MKTVHVVRLMLEQLGGSLVYTRRPLADYEGGKLCLPGGKVEDEQTLTEALQGESLDEIAYRITHPSYLFSHPPREAKGKLYEEHFFHACMHQPVTSLIPGSEVAGIESLSLEEAVARDDIAFGHCSAHAMLRFFDRTGVTTMDWVAANVQYQLTGKLPETRVYAPILAITPADLVESTIDVKQFTPVEREQYERFTAVSRYSKQWFERWMRRHGMLDDERAA